MTVQKFLSNGNFVANSKMIRNRIVCKDGYSLSVQASEGYYCTPRVSGASYYSAVEVGFPSVETEVFEEYTDGSGDIYPYVPIEVVEEVVAKHGGIV